MQWSPITRRLAGAQHGVIPAPVLLHLAETPEWTQLATVHLVANACVAHRVDVNAAAVTLTRTSPVPKNPLLG